MSTPDLQQRERAQKRVEDCRVALQDLQLTSANRDTLLKEFADALHMLYRHSRNVDAIDEAIPVLEELALLQPDGHQKRGDTLLLLGRFLVQSCDSHSVDMAKATRAIEVLREALRVLPSSDPNGHPVRSVLAKALLIEFESQRNVDALAEAIVLHRENMALFSPGHDSHIVSTNSLSLTLQRMYEDQGDEIALQEALTLMRGSLLLCPPGHPARAQCLHNLAMILVVGFWQHSDLKLLAESIRLQREVLESCSPDHPRRDIACNNLAYALLTQTDRNGDPDSLSEAIVLLNEALNLRSARHPGRPNSLNNLANAMLMRFERYQDSAALTTAITFLRESCGLWPSEHSRRAQSLDILAKALVLYFRQHGDWPALTEAITAHREVLQSRPQGHPLRPSSLINLGHALRARFERQRDNQSLEEEIAIYEAGLQICHEALPSRALFLFLMSHCLLRTDTPFFDFMRGISYIAQGLAHQTLSTMERLHEGIRCLGAMERAYRNDDLGLTSSDFDHAILELYVQVIRLLPRAASLGLNHTARLRAVAGSDVVSRNAAMRAILMGKGSEAVEMLEEGRGIFWSQALCLRASGLDCVPDEDRHALQEIFRVLEQDINRVDEPVVNISQYERQVEARRRLSEQAENLLEKLRSQPGLERLLMPSAFSSLVQRMPQGIVVMLLASDLGFCALLLDRNSAQARSVALSSSPDSVGLLSEATRAALPRDLESKHAYQDVNSHRLTLVKSTIGQSAELPLLNTLRKLWTSIVRPIIEDLALKRASDRERPRIWWCVTGEFSFLPIHAAGIYRGDDRQCLSDYAVSSYVPTLSVLIKARENWNPVARSAIAGLVVSEPSTGTRFLRHVESEANNVRSCFNSASAQILNPSATHMSVSELRSLLRGTTTHVLHLACHGIQDADALKSSFILADGNLTIEHIMELNLPHAALAYLSACHTAKGSKNQPDQSAHLAASMLFCGFKSVIGTMWSMSDQDGPNVARWFYEALFEHVQLDLDDVPYALNDAVSKLRQSGVPASRWASMVHVGG